MGGDDLPNIVSVYGSFCLGERDGRRQLKRCCRLFALTLGGFLVSFRRH